MLVTRPDHVPADRVIDLNVYDLPGQANDLHQAWKDVQDASPPLVWTPQNEGHWIAMRGDILAEVQADHERFSSRIIIVPKSVGEQHGLIPTTIDPPEHRPFRLLLNDSMSPSAVRRRMDQVRQTAIELIESFVAEGRVDFTADYAEIFPIRIFMTIVDLPMEDANHIRYLAACMTRPNPPLSYEEAKKAFADYLIPYIAQRRANPGNDMISYFLTADMGGGKLDDAQALSISTQILIAGVDTVVNFLSFAMLYLARHPEARAELAADPSMIMPATHEFFRRFGLVIIARTVREDMEFHGMSLKAGELVCIPTQVHGLDETINPDSMRIDFARKRSRHSAFGSGPHMCPGQELARVEVAVTIEEWLKRIPDFTVAADADTQCSGGIVGQINRLVLEWENK